MSPKYKVVMEYYTGETEELDEIFDTEEEAEEYGLNCCGNGKAGREILHMSNPGDYPYDEDDEDTFEIIEIDD